MQYTNEQTEQMYERILNALQLNRIAHSVAEIAEQTGLDETLVAELIGDLDEIHKVSGEVVYADEVAAEIGCSVDEVRAELGGDVVVIPDLYTVLG